VITDKASWFADASREDRWLVGVSGGADSVALLHLLAAAGFRELVVCHFDHGLRGGESAADADFVRELAGNLRLPFVMKCGDVRGRMAATGESLETAARHARHAFFAECAAECGTEKLLLAHHADDQAETVLWNFLRGSHGMKGMRAVQEMFVESGARLEIHRPLLAVRRAEIIGWLQVNGHAWREDASNAQPIAIRNRLRNEALPLLAEISGRDAAAALVRGAAESADAAELEAWALAQARVLDPQGRLHVPVLRALPASLQRAAFAAFLKEAGVPEIDRDGLARLCASLQPGGPAAVNLAGGFRMRRRAGRMLLEETSK
jgi:tRNA(Ile)-lysidine synthase